MVSLICLNIFWDFSICVIIVRCVEIVVGVGVGEVYFSGRFDEDYVGNFVFSIGIELECFIFFVDEEWIEFFFKFICN